MVISWSKLSKNKTLCFQTFKSEENKIPLLFSYSTILTKIWSHFGKYKQLKNFQNCKFAQSDIKKGAISQPRKQKMQKIRALHLYKYKI